MKELFSLDNKNISFAKEERIDKQYYIEFKITQEDAKDMISKAETFIDELDMFVDKLTEEKVITYREEFENAYFKLNQKSGSKQEPST